MSLPPAFEDRKPAEQIIGAVVVTMVFGIVTGFALGWNDRLLRPGGAGRAGGRIRRRHGAPRRRGRGARHPQAGLVLVTTIVGAIVGGLGSAYRARRERALPVA